MAQETNDAKKFSIIFVPSVEFKDQQNLTPFGPFFIDSRDLGFWSLMLWVLPVGTLLVLLCVVLLIRADWRAALLGRLRPRQRGTANYPTPL